jgi:hypothetical protein
LTPDLIDYFPDQSLGSAFFTQKIPTLYAANIMFFR